MTPPSGNNAYVPKVVPDNLASHRPIVEAVTLAMQRENSRAATQAYSQFGGMALARLNHPRMDAWRLLLKTRQSEQTATVGVVSERIDSDRSEEHTSELQSL